MLWDLVEAESPATIDIFQFYPYSPMEDHPLATYSQQDMATQVILSIISCLQTYLELHDVLADLLVLHLQTLISDLKSIHACDCSRCKRNLFVGHKSKA